MRHVSSSCHGGGVCACFPGPIGRTARPAFVSANVTVCKATEVDFSHNRSAGMAGSTRKEHLRSACRRRLNEGGSHLRPMAEANPNLFESQVNGGGISDFLASGLTTQCNPNRAPDHFDTSLETACSAPENSLPRALLKAGFQVWFAYFLAIQRGRTLGLDQLPHANLEDVTSQIASIHPHESVSRLFSHLFQGSRGRKRQGK